jgi:CHAT domain-containing protein
LSSYLPTLIPLVAVPGAFNANQETHRVLYVGTLESKEAVDELAAIRKALGWLPVDALVNHEASAAAIRRAISTHTFLHVAAHGIPSEEGPLEAGFMLSEGLFGLLDLATCHVTNGRLAVFLTCNSAAGDIALPNEALHLAGAAQQAGYPDVIATTMPLRDESAVPAVESLYAAVALDPDGISGCVADVLAATIDKLRKDPNLGADPLSWAPYAHFGWGLRDSP